MLTILSVVALLRLAPQTLHWPDRRPIASLIIGTAAAGWPKNPRGWFLDKTLDVATPRAAPVSSAGGPLVSWFYPRAFSVVDTAGGLIEPRREALRNAVTGGDVLMFRGWFDDPGNRLAEALAK